MYISLRIVLYSHDCGLATDPTLLATRKLWRQNQNHFNIVSLPDRKLGVKEYAVRAEITRVSGSLKIRVRRRNRDRNLHWDAFSGPPLSLVIGHRREGTTTAESRAQCAAADFRIWGAMDTRKIMPCQFRRKYGVNNMSASLLFAKRE
jgi:hypothetical protein